MTTNDRHWMTLALEEARKGSGLTAPNPPVGCVIVKDSTLLSSGWHQKAGTPHAERDALSKIDDVTGATAYVTLEPCSTHGITGACTDALIEAGISRVVYATPDPNPAHAGKADQVLQAAGIEVSSGVLEEECRHLIRGFSKVQTEGRPWVIAKTAMSLDGRITRPLGEGQWLTCPESREDVQLLRAEVDGIITSGETVRRDNPALTLRSDVISSKKQQPLRIVLSQTGLDESKYQLFSDGFPTRVFQNVPLEESLQQLAQEDQLTTVLLECGGGLMGAFLDAGLIDEFVIYYAPLVTGGPSPALGGKGVASLAERIGLTDTTFEKIGPDLRLRGLVGPPPPLER